MKKLLFTLSLHCFILIGYGQNEVSKKAIQKLSNESPEFFEIQSNQFGVQKSNSAEIGDLEEFAIDPSVITEIKANDFVSLSIEYQNQEMDLILYEANTISDAFKVYENNGNSIIDVTDQIDLGKQYWGMIDEDINSLVTMNISSENDIMMMVSSLERQFVIHKKESGSNQYIAYRNEELQLPTPQNNCEVLTVGDDATILSAPDFSSTNAEGCSETTVVPITIVADFDMYQDFGSSISNTTTYVVDLMTQMTAFYAAEDIFLTLADVFVNSAEDGYPHTSSIDDLNHFQNNLPNGATGRLLQLLSTTNSNLGGVAYLDVICNNSGFNIGYSNIFGSFNEIPTYSWDINVLGHELGHNLGSQHTHACAWSSGTIDDCGNLFFFQNGQTPEGAACWDENNPILPSTGGSIMSYCHLINGVGVNLSLGLLETGDAIRQSIESSAACLPTIGLGELTTLDANTAYTTITANRTCENGSWVEYFYDNETPDDFDDDLYVLAINPNGLNPGLFTDPDVTVSITSTTDALSNGGIEVSPDYKTNPNEFYLAKRFWTVDIPIQPTRDVGVRFPITLSDLQRLQENVTGTTFNNLVVLSLTEDADIDPENLHQNIAYTVIDEYLVGPLLSDTEYVVRTLNSNEYEIEFESSQLYGGAFGVTENLGNATPFVLDTFTATINDNLGVDIDWSTAKEFNSDLFLIEKSFNGEPFTQIGTKNAADFAATGATYQFTEQFAFVGETRYRLKMIGNRGTVIVSEEIILEGDNFGDDINIFPNPVTDGDLMIVDLRSIFPVEGEVDLSIYNVNGQLIRTFTSSGQVASVTIDGIATGTYFLEVRSNNNVETIQFVVTE